MPTACDTSVDADGSAAVTCRTSAATLTSDMERLTIAVARFLPLSAIADSEVSALLTLTDEDLPATSADIELTAAVWLPTVDGPQCARCVSSINSSSSFSFWKLCISSFSRACSASRTWVSCTSTINCYTTCSNLSCSHSLTQPFTTTGHCSSIWTTLPSVQAGMSTWQKLGEYTGILRDTPPRVRGLALFADAWLVAG